MFENRTQKYINDTKYHRILNIPMMDNEFIYGKNDLYALVIILKSLLKDNEVKDMINEVDKAISNLEFNLRSIPIDKVLDRMGFPNNYMDIVDIEKKELF